MTHHVTQPSNKEKAYSYIKEAVIARDFLPGDAVNERAIAKKLVMNSGPVRMAMEDLIEEGWLMASPSASAPRVTPVTKRHVTEITQLRLALEPMVVEQIMPRLGRKQMAYLDALLSQHDRLRVMPDAMEQFVGLDRSFHLYLASLTENNKLLQIMQSLFETLRRIEPGHLLAGNRFGACFEEHRTLVDSLRHADCAAAKEAICRHIDHDHDAIVFHIQEC